MLHCSFLFISQIMLLCDFKVSSLERYYEIAANLFTAAAQLIALKWKTVPPTVIEWAAKDWGGGF